MADRSVQSPVGQVPRQTERSGTSQVSFRLTSSNIETAGQTLENRSVRRNGSPSTDATSSYRPFRPGVGIPPDRRNDGTDRSTALLDHYSTDLADILDDGDTRLAEAIADGQRHRPRWQQHGACHGEPVATFFPVRGASSDPAKAICSTCPVLAQCRTWGLGQPDHGIIGGLSAKQRRAARARRARSAV